MSNVENIKKSIGFYLELLSKWDSASALPWPDGYLYYYELQGALKNILTTNKETLVGDWNNLTREQFDEVSSFVRNTLQTPNHPRVSEYITNLFAISLRARTESGNVLFADIVQFLLDQQGQDKAPVAIQKDAEGNITASIPSGSGAV
jgi:hypothetical protein